MLPYVSLGLLLLAGTSLAESPRIVGGEPTTIETYPYIVQVDIFYEAYGTWSQYCGGNILTNEWIMSAAHCFIGWSYAPELRRIRAGSTYRESGGFIHYIEFARNHPEYRQAAWHDADITLLKLTTPLTYSSTIRKGTIITHRFILPDNHPVIQAGWGDLKFEGDPPEQLHHARMYTINNKLCKDRYWSISYGEVTENMICVGLLDVGGRDACQGDSGGPVYAQGENSHVIVGVVSWGYECANATYPGVTTRVASYTNWIIENAK